MNDEMMHASKMDTLVASSVSRRHRLERIGIISNDGLWQVTVNPGLLVRLFRTKAPITGL
jgi:hypothetical protein